MKPSFSFSPSQLDAIESRGENLLVAAGAGSGKTTVLVQRILNYISKGGSIDTILALTFTNAAAADMKEKLAKTLSALAEETTDNEHLQRQLSLLPQAQISTIHAFCLELLRRNYFRLNIDAGFRVAGEAEINLLEIETLHQYIEDAYEEEGNGIRALADAYGGNKDDSSLLTIVRSLHHFCRSRPQPWLWLQAATENFGAETLAEYPFAADVQRRITQSLQRAAQLLSAAGEEAAYISGKWQAIIDNEQQQIITALEQSKSLDALLNALPTLSFGRLSAEKGVAAEVKALVSEKRDKAKKIVSTLKAKYAADSPEAQAAEMQQLQPLLHSLYQLVTGYDRAFAAEKKRRNWLDFSDMEHFCLALLEDEEFAAATRDSYQEILIDEYQDINEVQEAILQRLCGADNLFAVGDVKQSIYRFRLAEPQLFLSKYNDYGKTIGGRRIDLNSNYRSETAVIAAVNYIFRQLMREDVAEIAYDSDAELKTEKTAISPSPELYLIDMQAIEQQQATAEPIQLPSKIEAEARLMARRIKELVAEGYSYSDMAILLRATKSKESIIKRELAKAAIPAISVEGDGYLTTPEVTLILSALKVIDNPRQDIALAAVLRSQLADFSAEDLLEIRLNNKAVELYSALLLTSEASGELAEKCRRFLTRLAKWRQIAGEKSVAEVIAYLYHENGYYQLVGAMPDGDLAQANLRLLQNEAYDYQQTGYAGLFRFIRFLSESEQRQLKSSAARLAVASDDAVHIMSIHRSKGLEFPIVFVAGLSGQFNFMDERRDIIWERDAGLGPVIADRSRRQKHASFAHRAVAARLRELALAEEIRIYYVALTRAKERLILLASVNELPKQINNWATAAVEGETALPAGYLLEANSPLSWFMAALIRHSDAAPVRDYGNAGKIALLDDIGSWQLLVVPLRELLAEEAEISQESALPSSEREIPSHIKAALAYRYPHLEQVNYPAKWTVSMLRALAADATMTEEAAPKSYVLEEQQELAEAEEEMPTTEQAQQSSARAAVRGTVYHTLLEKLDFAAADSEQAINIQIQKLITGGQLSEAEAQLIKTKNICQFAKSPLARRFAKAEQAVRELAFTFMIPTDFGEEILVQGMLDAAFAEEDGWVLLDYKTGGWQKSDEQLLLLYAEQLELYQQALERLLQVKVKEKHLVMLDLARIVTVPD